MKTRIQKLLLIMLLCIPTFNYANNKKNDIQTFEVSRIINQPIEKVWSFVADDFTGIAKAHPKLSGSHLIEGSPISGEGCERICYLNDSKKKYTKEVLKNYNRDNYSFDAKIYELGGLPMDETVSVGHYKLEKIDEQSCKLIFTMEYRTKPAFLGSMVKGKFKSQISDYLLAVDHYLNTGEEVHKSNFKAIKKEYKS